MGMCEYIQHSYIQNVDDGRKKKKQNKTCCAFDVEACLWMMMKEVI